MSESAKTKGGEAALGTRHRVVADRLRWTCDEAWLAFESTEQVEPLARVIGQDDAVDALRFGLEIDAPGQNVFVRGLTGTGRMSLLKELMTQIRPACALADDRCYVHNFNHPSRPHLISLPRGQAEPFGAQIDELIGFIREDLMASLSSETIRTRQEALDEQVQVQMRRLDEPLQKELAANGLVMIPVKTGQTEQPAIFPVIDGKPVPPDQFAKLRAEGRISDAEAQRIAATSEACAKRLRDIGQKIAQLQNEHRAAVRKLFETETRRVLGARIDQIQERFADEQVKVFLGELVEDLLSHLGDLKQDASFLRRYRVNVLLAHRTDEDCPIVIENIPTLQNLLGGIERDVLPGGLIRSDHLMILSGSLLRADGGYLIMDARDVLSEPGAWKVLVRTLRSGLLEIVPSEWITSWPGPLLKPDPIPVKVKVILLGDPGLYHLLDSADADFAHLFKVLADFDTTIGRDRHGVQLYAQVLAHIGRQEHLAPFARSAVAALTEHGARIAGQRDRLSTRFGRLADLAREAAFLARQQGVPTVRADQVHDAVRRSRRRADLPARRFRRLVCEGTIQIETRGQRVGQINGLAVIGAGPLTYGFPSRITATVGPGSAGTINIEREAELSGAIHTKGFYILGGLLRHLLQTRHPLTFSASIAFEQSYGGIDGDSASGAEMCCLLSALTGTALRQEIAMTGAIDQLGHIQAVGAVAEKIEGFYDTCQDVGLTATQGVIIPQTNVDDLMLRPDIVAACRENRVHVYAVQTLHEALEILSGRPTGRPDDGGGYPDGTLLHDAVDKVHQYWQMTQSEK